MGLNDTVSADRPHIGFFGLRNAGKSSVVNAVTGQNLSVVSEIKGTTTDPVQKAMELLPAGPVVVIDTPGMDDTGRLGEERVRRARRVLDRTDVAILVVDGTIGLQLADHELIRLFDDRRIPYIIAYNKCDLLEALPQASENEIYVSAAEGTNIWTLKERIAQLANRETSEKCLIADLLTPGDLVVLVVPVDSAAPKGRLILPQQQTIRDILEASAVSVVTGVGELPHTLASLRQKPRLVVTDSQAFGAVSRAVPPDIHQHGRLLHGHIIIVAGDDGPCRAQRHSPGCRTAILCSSPRAVPITVSVGTSVRSSCLDGYGSTRENSRSLRLPLVGSSRTIWDSMRLSSTAVDACSMNGRCSRAAGAQQRAACR